MPTTSSQVINDYSTSGKQDTGNTSLASIDSKVATSANQSTANSSLSSIDTKLSSQATAANQATANASLASIDSKVATSANQSTANSSLASIDSKVATAANQSTANSSLASIDTKLSSQATAANQTTANSSLASIDSKVATASNQATANTSLSSIDTKLSSQATAANQATEISKLTSIDGKMNSLGQKTMANSMPVVIASDQSGVPVTGTFWQTTQPISAASLPLPTGAASSANQTIANSSLSSIDTKLSIQATAANQTTMNGYLANIDAGLPNSLGQLTKANSTSVVLASDYQVPVVNQIINFPVYEDMNATTGGVARGTNLTTTYTNIYSYTGAGLFYGFRITFQTLNVMQIRILIDGTDVLMGSTGLSLADMAAAALYNFSATVSELGLEMDGNSFTFQPPAPLKFSSSIVVKSSVISGASKQFLAGFAVRSA